jgi:hypothetical protein
MRILEKILADIERLKDISALRLADFYVCSPFTVVQLSDGSIGSAGNYDVQNHTVGYEPMRVKDKYQRQISNEPLLLQTLREDQSFVGLSLHTAILSALSQSLLSAPSLRTFGLTCRPVDNQHSILHRYLRTGDIVTMIGYGGGLDVFCTSEKVKHLYVCDFMFSEQQYRDIAWGHIKKISIDPTRVTLVDGMFSENKISLSDMCFITGSALCNGSMERLLSLAHECREIVVQGPSCSLFPIEFFRRSVTLFLTTLKTPLELEAGKSADDRIFKVVDQHYLAISPLGLIPVEVVDSGI